MEKSRISFAQSLSIAYECTFAIGNSLNLAEMLHQVIHTMVRKTNALRGTIWVKDGGKELQPVASAGIRISDVLAEKRIGSLRSVLKQIQQGQRFVIRTKDDKDFLQHLAIVTEKEEAVLIVPVNDVAILHLVYAGRERADEPLGNLLASLSPRLSVAIAACVAHENIIKEIQVKEETENELKKKTDQLISSQKEIQRLYAESEEARRSLVSILEDVSEKENALRTSEEKYRSLIDQSQDAIYLLYEGKFELINRRFEKLLGYTLEKTNAPDFHFMNLVAPKSKALVEERVEKVARGETVSPRYEFTALSRDGTEIEAETSVSYIQYKGGIAAQGILRDITERKRAERRIQHLTDVLRAIRNVNQLITREKDRQRLLQGICETLIETRSYHYAWVAIFGESGELVTWAEAGFGENFLSFVDNLRRGELPICGPRALRESGVVMIEDTLLDCIGCPLSEGHHGRSSMVVRLEHAGKVYGLLTVSATTDLGADEEEQSLFEEIAGDIAFALHSIELEEKRKQAEELYTTMANSSQIGVYIVQDGKLQFVNHKFREFTGFSEEELLGRDPMSLVHPEDRKMVRENAVKLLKGECRLPYEFRSVSKDGGTRWVMEMVASISYRGKRAALGSYMDITERKRMEEDLAASEERYRSLVTNVKLGVFRHSKELKGLVLEANPAMEEITGYSRQELLGMKVTDLYVHPEERLVILEKLSATREKVRKELRWRKKDGSEITVAVTKVAVRDNSGEILYIDGVLEDITERKRMEREFEERREYLAAVLRDAPDAIVSLDDSHRVLEWNSGAESLFGYTYEEVQGKLLEDLITRPDVRAEAEFFTKQSLSGEKVGPLETVRYRKDGTPVNVILAVSPITIGGRFFGGVAVYTDITERKRMEQEIKERREYLAAVLRDAPDAIVSLDDSHRILEWNSGAESLFGYTYDEVQGKDLDDVIARPDVRVEAEFFTKQLLSGGQVGPLETVRYRKDGTPVDVIVAGSPIIIEHELAGAVAVYTDITERKRAEKALEGAKQKIESLHEIARRLATCETAENVYQLTVEAAEQILEFSLCTLEIVEEGHLVAKATSSGLPPEMSLERPLAEGGLAAKTYRTGKTIIFDSLDEVPEATPTVADIKSGISAPIGNIGVFQVISPQAAAFSKDDALLLELLLGYTAETVKRLDLQNELKEQAIRDPLTGAYNRRYFTQALAQEVARSTRYDRPIAFLMIDVNRFKEINDRFGHQTGDRVLQAIADLLQEQVRESDTVIRYGGDEFLIILPETYGETEVVKERITAAVTRRNQTNRLIDFPVTLSIGSAVWTPSEAESVEEVLAEADSRMYEAKREHDSGDLSG